MKEYLALLSSAFVSHRRILVNNRAPFDHI